MMVVSSYAHGGRRRPGQLGDSATTPISLVLIPRSGTYGRPPRNSRPAQGLRSRKRPRPPSGVPSGGKIGSPNHLDEPAGVVDRGGAALPEGVVVEVAVTIDALVAPRAEAFRPRLELVVLEEMAAAATVEADVRPVCSDLNVGRNLPADGQAERRVVLAETVVDLADEPAL